MVFYRDASNAATAERNATFRREVRTVAARSTVRKVCDVGGGPNPLLGPDEIERDDLDYTLLDISSEQLAKAPVGYRTLVADVTHEAVSDVRGSFDLVFSQWVAEHVHDGRAFHTGVRSLLKPGGYAVHLFPTLFAIPFVVNRLLPERASEPLTMLRGLTPGPTRERAGKFGKFPAHYSWCRGPSRRQLARLESAGFTIERYIAFFGHAYYTKLGPIASLEQQFARTLVKHPLPYLTSSAVVVLQKH